TAGVTLRSLVPKDLVTNMKSLFDNFEIEIENGNGLNLDNDKNIDKKLISSEVKDRTNLNTNMDNINRKYGEHTIMFGSSFRAV
ncbi:hypothetical protein ACI3PL_27130, partial [Lacticaseibacillus paracasei]